MRERNSEARGNTKYKDKRNYWLSTGFYILCAAIWAVIAKGRLDNSSKIIAVIAMICTVGFIGRAGYEMYAYVRDKK